MKTSHDYAAKIINTRRLTSRGTSCDVVMMSQHMCSCNVMVYVQSLRPMPTNALWCINHISSLTHILTPSPPHSLTPSLRHILTPSYPHTSYPHILISSHPHTLTPSHPHSLVPSHPHILTPSLPRTLTPSHPHTLTSSYPHSLTHKHTDLQKLEREARICRMLKHHNIGEHYLTFNLQPTTVIGQQCLTTHSIVLWVAVTTYTSYVHDMGEHRGGSTMVQLSCRICIAIATYFHCIFVYTCTHVHTHTHTTAVRLHHVFQEEHVRYMIFDL